MTPEMVEALKLGGWAVAPFAMGAVLVLWARYTKGQDERKDEIERLTTALVTATETIKANAEASKAMAAKLTDVEARWPRVR